MATDTSAIHADVLARPHASLLTINRIGLWLFLLSESFLFAALLSSRYFLQGVFLPGEVDQLLGLVLTGVLLLSSLSAYRAEVPSAHGDQRGFRRNILFTIGLWVIFVVGVGFEWKGALDHFPPHTG